jgi:putative DNA primase/helicase
MSRADVLDAHPELIAARRAVAHAPDKLRAVESEASRLIPLIECGEIARGKVVACLIDVATAYGLCGTDRGRENVEHVIRMGLAGQFAGVGYVASSGNDTARTPESCPWSPLRPLNLGEFLKLQLPSRRLMLAPWLSEKGTAMIYSPRGVGKTLLDLGVGYAVASGDNLLGWSAPEPRRVLYIDGEMTAAEMQHRLAAIVAGFQREALPDYFRMLSADVTERGLPDLATPEGQRAFDDAIGDAELTILDNISTLCRSGKENEAEGWQGVQDWALAHRRAGRSLLFVHHAGKGGNQRGTSKREDVLDSVIALRRPHDYRPDQGARFEVHFEKHRGFHGPDAESFEARYEVRDSASIWTRTAIADVELKRVADAMRDGMSLRDAAEELGMTKSKVERLKAKAKEQGLLND